jgi:hypothetical protein
MIPGWNAGQEYRTTYTGRDVSTGAAPLRREYTRREQEPDDGAPQGCVSRRRLLDEGAALVNHDQLREISVLGAGRGRGQGPSPPDRDPESRLDAAPIGCASRRLPFLDDGTSGSLSSTRPWCPQRRANHNSASASTTTPMATRTHTQEPSPSTGIGLIGGTPALSIAAHLLRLPFQMEPLGERADRPAAGSAYEDHELWRGCSCCRAGDPTSSL